MSLEQYSYHQHPQILTHYKHGRLLIFIFFSRLTYAIEMSPIWITVQLIVVFI